MLSNADVKYIEGRKAGMATLPPACRKDASQSQEASCIQSCIRINRQLVPWQVGG